MINGSDIFVYHKYWERELISRHILIPTLYYPHCSYSVDVQYCERKGILFVGEYEFERAESLAMLSQNNEDVRIFGPGWSRAQCMKHNFAKTVKIRSGFLGREKYFEIASQSLICLNFFRQKVKDRLTDRPIELITRGCCVVSEYSTEIERLFKDQHEIVLFRNNKELLEAVDRIKEMPKESYSIGKNGMALVQAKKLSTVTLAKYICEICTKL